MKEKNKEPLFHIVKRDTLPLHQALGIRALAILLALILCGIITTITTECTGKDRTVYLNRINTGCDRCNNSA